MEDDAKTRAQLIDELVASRARVAELESLALAEREKTELTARLARESEIVAEVGRIISSSLDIGEVYERFANELQKVITFESVSIDSIDFGREPSGSSTRPAWKWRTGCPRTSSRWKARFRKRSPGRGRVCCF